MKNYLVIFLLSILCLPMAMSITDNDIVAYWDFDNNDKTDQTGNGYDYDADTGSTSNTSGIINDARYYDGSDYLTASDYLTFSGVADWTVGYWARHTVDGDDMTIGQYNQDLNRFWHKRGSNHYYLTFAGGVDITVPLNEELNTWNLWVIVHKANGTVYIYQNTTLLGIGDNSHGFVWDAIGRTYTSDAYNWVGDIDEAFAFNRSLTTSDISDLYNSGAGLQYPYSPAVPDNMTITVLDGYNSNPVNGINVTFNGTTYQNATGNVVTIDRAVDAGGTFDIDVEGTAHFDKTYEGLSSSSNYDAYLYASEIMFEAYLINGSATSANFTVNGSVDTVFNLSVGDYNVSANKTGYYGVLQSFNVSALDNKTVNVTGLYTTKLLVSPRDILNNNTISDANITLSNAGFGYSETYSGVVNATFNITPGTYLVEIEATNRSDYSANLTINASGEITYYAYMYAYNSLWVYAYDQDTGSSIINFNVTVQNANNSYSEAGAGGVARINNILSGSYDVIVAATGYSSSTYSVTMTDNSHQTLNAYLSAATDTFIFIAKDKSTNDLVEGATITQKRFINGTLTTIETKDTDITGRVQFVYVNGVEYTFIASEPGYENKEFLLEILFSEYTLFLTPTTTTNETVYFDDVTISLEGYSFVNNGTSYIAFDFGSASGTLEEYYVNYTLPNGTIISVVGTSAPGSELNASSFVSGVNYGEVAVIDYGYKSTLNAGYKEYSMILAFTTWDSVAGSSSSFIEDTSDMSDLEKVFWATIITIIISGLVGLVGLFMGEPMLFAAAGALVSFAAFAALKFINWTVFGLVAFILFLLMLTRLMNQ